MSKINQLQLLQQNLQNILQQKQQIQSQMIELDSALTALEKTDKSYRILGNIMLSADKEGLKKDLAEKKEMLEIRLKNFSKQEDKLKKDTENLQKEVVEEINKEKGKGKK